MKLSNFKRILNLNFDIYDKFILLTLGFISFASRYPFIEKIQSHWDGPQYSIAIVRYSFEQQTPAPPGYPLYITLGKLFNIFVHNPHLAILLVSVVSTIIGSVVLYSIGKLMYSRIVGVASSVIFLTGSTFYYFGLTPYAYILTPITTTLLAYITYLIYIKKKQLGLALGIVFGITFGIRPQEIILTLPILLLGLIYLKRLEKIKFITIFILITLVWLIPVLYTVGITNFFTQSYVFLKGALINNTYQQRAELMIKGFLLSFGLSPIFLMYFVLELRKKPLKIIKNNISIIIFYLVWMLPALAYNFFLRTEHAGYQMSYLAAFLMLISYAIWKITQKNKANFIFLIFIVALFNLYWFFYNRDPYYVKPYRPTSFHYSDIQKNDLKTGSKINYILSNYKPSNTILITNSVLWRVYGYYFKDYLVIGLDGLVDNNPFFYHTERDIKNWNMNVFNNKSLELIIPSRINYIVLPDDENNQWIEDLSFKLVHLPGNSKIAVLSVNPGDKFIYNYHYLTITKRK